MTVPPGVMLPSELERQKIFYTLKRWSSYTAWNRILGFYDTWATTIENSVREASTRGLEDKTDLRESDYVQILEDLAHCDDGVSRLRTGDKRVFRCDANGDFFRARRRTLAHWASMLGPYGRIAIGENSIDEMVTPGWAEFARAGWELDQAWGECSPDIIEEQDQDGEAPTIYGDWFRQWLPRMTFPKELSGIPEPTEQILIRTDRMLPYSGIWEPVEVPARNVISVFKSPPPRGPFPIVGCMNYLHAGAIAPRAKQETPTDSLRANVTWRLLWRDDRYLDGTIPAEEASYLFLYPESRRAAAPAQPDIGCIVVRESGQLTPRAGRWVLQDSLSIAVTLPAGERLPSHEGRTARWVLTDS